MIFIFNEISLCIWLALAFPDKAIYTAHGRLFFGHHLWQTPVAFAYAGQFETAGQQLHLTQSAVVRRHDPRYLLLARFALEVESH
jgi:hypothetical protein